MDPRYCICQRIEFVCDSHGLLCAWHPHFDKVYAINLYGIQLLQAFGTGASLTEACNRAGIHCDETARRVLQKLVKSGFLLPEESESRKSGSSPFVFRDIESLVLPVTSLTESVTFYRDMLGLLVYTRETGDIALRAGETSLVLRQTHSENILGYQINFELRHTEFPIAINRLKDMGIQGQEILDVESLLTFQFRDPDGHVISIRQQDLRNSRTLHQLILDGHNSYMEIDHNNSSQVADRRPSWVRPIKKKVHTSGGADGLWASWQSDKLHHLPWYSVHMDQDLIEAIGFWAGLPGRFIELGCGTGMVSARLASIGYDTLGIDISEPLIERARAVFERNNPRLAYDVADVTKSLQRFGQFDYAFDRGCFHQLSQSDQANYVRNVSEIIKPGGKFFLKIFSSLEPDSWGPTRFSNSEIASLFSDGFRVIEQLTTSFESTLTHDPKALFSVFIRIE